MNRKHLTWLHISDIHIKSGDNYERDTVLKSLIRSMERFKSRDIKPDLIFFTGDVAFGGKEDEYASATKFFDELTTKLCLNRSDIYVIPGNHDVDRMCASGLKRTLGSRSDSITYFGESGSKPHIAQRQHNYIQWHNNFFENIRRFSVDTTCGPYETKNFSDFVLGILPLNTSAFCLDDNDSGKLWLGERCLDATLEKISAKADLTIALMHHPFDWLHEAERTQIRARLNESVDCVLRGHLHQTELECSTGTAGSSLSLAAGASYQGSAWPNKAMFVEVFDEYLRIIPIRFENTPSPIWVIDTSVFPDEIDFSGRFPLKYSSAVKNSPKNVADIDGIVISSHKSAISTRREYKQEEQFQKSFEQDLLTDVNEQILYVEPRLSAVSQGSVNFGEVDIPLTSVIELVCDSSSYLINVPSEHGGTLLAKRLAPEFTKAGHFVELRDAPSLPNYRAKLRTEFTTLSKIEGMKNILILDNFNQYGHEKLFNELKSLDVFTCYVFVAKIRGFSADPSWSLSDDKKFKVLYLWPLSLQDIRKFASFLGRGDDFIGAGWRLQRAGRSLRS